MHYIFEMANNHQGSVDHAKEIIQSFASLAKEEGVEASIKLQFRQLDSFIHPHYKNSDLKFVKRFNSTKLSKDQFSEIVNFIHEQGLNSVATPFDNESIAYINDLNVQSIKIASCSIDDWPLLEEVCKINKKIIISTAGADMETLKQVYDLFKSHKRDFAFMHCVGEYPTPSDYANLERIKLIQQQFPDIEVGFSTHESPKERSLASAARAMGCTILEKHVGVETESIKLNDYSCTVNYMRKIINEIQEVEKALSTPSNKEKESLRSLKRGVYLSQPVKEGVPITKDDLYFSMPVQPNQMDASHYREILNKKTIKDLEKDDPLLFTDISQGVDNALLQSIVSDAKALLNEANIPLSGKENVELSCHYGIKNFYRYGAIIVDKINREYCKKLIVVLPNQSHPTHHHIKKEEAFELLYGDCVLVLNGEEITMEKGSPVLIARGVKHAFRSLEGCVLEEVSTTHVLGDSVYEDITINSYTLNDRKIKVTL